MMGKDVDQLKKKKQIVSIEENIETYN